MVGDKFYDSFVCWGMTSAAFFLGWHILIASSILVDSVVPRMHIDPGGWVLRRVV